MRQFSPQGPFTLSLAVLLLALALALAPGLLLAHAASDHAEHGGCELSELALDVNAAGSLEHGAKANTPSDQHPKQPISSRHLLPQRRTQAFSARAPPRVTAQIASIHPA